MLTFIGCGNRVRRDDGVGVIIAQRLSAHFGVCPLPEVRAFDCGTAGFEVMYRARGSDALIVIDASSTGAEPGTVHELGADALAVPTLPRVSLHEFRWDHALSVGRAIYRDQFPRDVRVILIEAAELGLGEGLSPAVAVAAERVYQRLLERSARYSACYPGREGSAATPGTRTPVGPAAISGAT